MQTMSPGALTFDFAMDDVFLFVLHEVFLCLLRRQDAQIKIQSFKTLNFDGRDPFSTNLFILTLGRWSKTSCHQSHSCFKGVKTSGFINVSRVSFGIVEATSRIFLALVGIEKESGVSASSIFSLVACTFLPS